ncbi:hypothetical protein LPU83_3115 [Rhizobium favelukesii]|uniref:Uncharacterized protein n=1 Tax=Rhizobium favelukesii TaxID=348824 RepID=W6REM3_9HYPH|nr:hypothetical protein LPU83_3115 [Rhizobium favelukesii]
MLRQEAYPWAQNSARTWISNARGGSEKRKQEREGRHGKRADIF